MKDSENCDSDENVRLQEGLFRGSCQDVVMRFVVVVDRLRVIRSQWCLSSHLVQCAQLRSTRMYHSTTSRWASFLKVGVSQALCE